MRFRMTALLVLFVASGWAQPADKPASAAKATPPRTGPGSSQSDQAIESIIRQKFAKSKISKNNFQVRVQGGVATLTGQTDVIQHKGVATRLAKSAGAKTVDNQIRISDAARQKAADKLEATRKKAQIKKNSPG